jgi:hypothetical protein
MERYKHADLPRYHRRGLPRPLERIVRWLIAVAGCVLVAFVPLAAARGAMAAGVSTAPEPAVYLAVDESGSMFGRNGSDPGNLRGTSALLVLTGLGALHDILDPQVAVATFGTNVKTVQPLAPATPQLAAALAPALAYPTNMGWTNMAQVLADATQALAAAPNTARTVVIITDSWPDLGPSVSSAQLKSAIMAALRPLKAAGIHLVMLRLTDPTTTGSHSDIAAWLPFWQQATASTGGELVLLQSPQDLLPAIIKVLAGIVAGAA